MKKYLRFRHFLMVGGTLFVMVFMYLTDPNGGALTTMLAAQLATPIVAVWFAHLARKALFDYLDMAELLEKAKESSIGAAICFASICVVIFALLGLFGNQVHAQSVETYIPEQAYKHLPTLKTEQENFWGSHPKRGF
jgi:hypothetical protein